MKRVRTDAMQSPLFAGTWLSLGSSITAEMTAAAGFDWILIDHEHGLGETTDLLHQLQAIGDRSGSIVRVGGIDPIQFKRVLDLGPSGLMVPCVNDADDARDVVRLARIAPKGTRGIAQSSRACGYALDFKSYVAEINENLLIMAQIETRRGLANAAEIAAVDGIDVLFVGPVDLSIDLGLDPDAPGEPLREHLSGVADAARRHGKKAGILLRREAQIRPHLDMGFSVVTLGSDRGQVSSGMRTVVQQFRAAREFAISVKAASVPAD